MPNKCNNSRNGRRSSLRMTPLKPEGKGNGTRPIRLASDKEAGDDGHIEYFIQLADIALGLKKSKSR